MTVAAVGGVPSTVRDRLLEVSEGLELTFAAADHPLRDLEAAVRALPDDLGWHQAGVDPAANAVALEVHPGRGAHVADELAARVPDVPFTVNESEPLELAQLVTDTCVSRRNCTPVARGGVEIQPSNVAYWNDSVKTHRITARRVTADQYVGEASCKLGRTTGNTCGTITATNQNIIVGGTTLTGQTFTNVCALPGDSGGSVLRTAPPRASFRLPGFTTTKLAVPCVPATPRTGA